MINKLLVKPIKPTKPYLHDPPEPPKEYETYFRSETIYTDYDSKRYCEFIDVSKLNDLITKYNPSKIFVITDDYSNSVTFEINYQETRKLSKEEYDKKYNYYLSKLKTYERKQKLLAPKIKEYEKEMQKYNEELKIYEEEVLKLEQEQLERRLKQLKSRKK